MGGFFVRPACPIANLGRCTESQLEFATSGVALFKPCAGLIDVDSATLAVSLRSEFRRLVSDTESVIDEFIYRDRRSGRRHQSAMLSTIGRHPTAASNPASTVISN